MFTSPIRNSMLAFGMPLLDDDLESGGGKESTESSTGKESSGKDKGGEFKPITTQEDFDSRLASRLARARRQEAAEIRKEVEEEIRAELAAEVAKENEDYKALYEAEVKKTQKLEGEKKARELEELRTKVATDAGLPESSMKFLTGETEAELKASAKELSELVKPKKAEDTDTGKTNNSGTGRKTEKAEDYEDPAFWNLDIIPAKK